VPILVFFLSFDAIAHFLGPSHGQETAGVIAGLQSRFALLGLVFPALVLSIEMEISVPQHSYSNC
jgi:hypothetical protein